VYYAILVTDLKLLPQSTDKAMQTLCMMKAVRTTGQWEKRTQLITTIREVFIMIEVKVWPDGSWVYEDDQLPEDFSNDYMFVVIPDSIDDVDKFILTSGWIR